MERRDLLLSWWGRNIIKLESTSLEIVYIFNLKIKKERDFIESRNGNDEVSG